MANNHLPDCAQASWWESGPSEPQMRRWPHPIPGEKLPEEAAASLHYISCALSYQNQLLSDIKVLLEQLELYLRPAPESF